MRYVSVDSAPATPVAGDELNPLAGIRPVTPLVAHRNNAGNARHDLEYEPNQLPEESALQGETERRTSNALGRRKLARRLSRQPMLLDLRSGIDQRRNNQRESDIVEHIDVKA